MGGGATDGGPKKSETYKNENGSLTTIETYKDEEQSLRPTIDYILVSVDHGVASDVRVGVYMNSRSPKTVCGGYPSCYTLLS